MNFPKYVPKFATVYTDHKLFTYDKKIEFQYENNLNYYIKNI